MLKTLKVGDLVIWTSPMEKRQHIAVIVEYKWTACCNDFVHHIQVAGYPNTVYAFLNEMELLSSAED